jgi:hypothetical protein
VTAPPPRSILDLLVALWATVALLIRQELQLLRAEISQKVTRFALSAALVCGGVVILLIAVIVSLQAIAHLLIEQGFAVSSAFFIVAGGTLVLAAAMLLVGLRGLKLRNLKPSKTLEQVRRDVAAVKDQLHL